MGMTLPSPIAGVRKEAKTVVAAKSRIETMPSSFFMNISNMKLF